MAEGKRKTLHARGGISATIPAPKASPTKSSATAWVPDRAEVIWIQHTPAAGKEIPDQHPMLVASTRAFNERTGLVIGFPMTHSESHADNPFAIRIQGPKGAAYILSNQPKSFDWRARDARKHAWGEGHDKQLDEALEIVAQICGMKVA